MDIQDFKGNFVYKLIVPATYLLSWTLMLVGPAFFAPQYQTICITFLIYMSLIFTRMAIGSIIAWCKFNKTIQKAINLKNNPPSLTQDLRQNIIHAFIIPNYKEEIELLTETLEQLANHTWASRKYAIFLAMEAHQQNSEIKALAIISNFKTRFLHMGYTVHHIREFEQKGKASNVSWCGQHLNQIYFEPLKIDPSLVMITVLDSDSHTPEIYIHEIEEHLRNEENFQNRHKFIYSPNQIFSRNHLQVPGIVRACDQLHAASHNAMMPSLFGIAFPLSNYSLSYNLIKRIGFWDTCEDAIGEDMHTTLKASWKTEGETISVPIYVPFNQVNLETGKGYCSNIEAKFWQSQRHCSAVTEVSYCLNMLVKNTINWRSIVNVYLTLQLYIVPATVPWAMASLVYQPMIIYRFYKPSPQLIAFPYINILLQYVSLCANIYYFFYFIMKKRGAQVLYNKAKQSWIRLFQTLILFGVVAFVIELPSFVVSAFSSLFGGRQYHTAEKLSSKKQIQHYS